MSDLTAMQKEFMARFGAVPEFFQAPGRVNLIGEHTDYNAGFVMPVALQFQTTVGVAPRTDRVLRIRSTNLDSTQELELPEPKVTHRARGAEPRWTDYVLGVAWALQEHGLTLRGADLLIDGDVPLGAGLSSSASLEVAVALALAAQSQADPGPVALGKICQRAENDFVGMRCGIMDQFAAIMGRAGHALLIDCRSLDHALVPLQPGPDDGQRSLRIVVCNTMVRHALAGSEYNRRREECEAGVRILARTAPGAKTLRDVSPALLEQHRALLDPTIYRRCRHVVTENARTVEAASALRAGDVQRFGRLLRESHRSLRDDYEVSCAELDLMVRLAESMDGVYSARMTGGGFGGCTVNLVRAEAVVEFSYAISERYLEASGRAPDIYVCEAADGAGPVRP